MRSSDSKARSKRTKKHSALLNKQPDEPTPPTPIGKHRRYRNNQILKKEGLGPHKTGPNGAARPTTEANKTRSYSPEIQNIVALFKAVSERMVDIHQESKEQRQILGELVACLGQLKRSVDELAKRLKE